MKYLDLKTIDQQILPVSKIVLGSSGLATLLKEAGEEETFKYIDAFRANGGNAIDTGRAYGGELDQISFGLCESIISRYIKSRDCADELIVITKGGFPDLDVTNLANMTRFRITREAILGDFYTSYDRIQKKQLDVFLLHRDDPTKPIPYIMDILDEIARTGLVKVIGVSNWSMERVLEANAYARSKNQVEIAVNEIMWSYAYTDRIARNDKTLEIMNAKVYQEYLEHPLPVLAFSSQARGLFSCLYNNTYSWDEVPTKNPWYNFPSNEERWNKIKEYCDKTGVSPASAAVAYLTSNQIDTAAIIGCMSVAEVNDSMSNADLTLTPEELAWFDDVQADDE